MSKEIINKELCIKINKAFGESGHIRQESFVEWNPYNVAVFHCFLDANKRTAFILLEALKIKKMGMDGIKTLCLCSYNRENINYIEHYAIKHIIPMNKEWLRILNDC